MMTIPLTPLIIVAHRRGLFFGATVIMTNSTLLDDLKNRLPMSWLRERDIDLLVCSELHFPESPLHQLFKGAWNDGVGHLVGAWVSYQDSDGETDLVAAFTNGARYLVLLIENKIDADFQPHQPERYLARAGRWRAEMSPDADVETILLAPEEYFENRGSEVFDRLLSYEEVIAGLVDSSDARTNYLANALRAGIESHRVGYKPEHNEATTLVWGAIWELSNSLAPQLRMRHPESKPIGAGFIYFYDAEGVSATETKRRAFVVYKPAHGNADLQFSNMREETWRKALGGLLASDMAVAQAGKSASIRIKVPVVDFGKAPDEQEDAIRQGLLASERLRQFFIENGLLELIPSV